MAYNWAIFMSICAKIATDSAVLLSKSNCITVNVDTSFSLRKGRLRPSTRRNAHIDVVMSFDLANCPDSTQPVQLIVFPPSRPPDYIFLTHAPPPVPDHVPKPPRGLTAQPPLSQPGVTPACTILPVHPISPLAPTHSPDGTCRAFVMVQCPTAPTPAGSLLLQELSFTHNLFTRRSWTRSFLVLLLLLVMVIGHAYWSALPSIPYPPHTWAVSQGTRG